MKYINLFILAVVLSLPFILMGAAAAANESTTYAQVFVINSAPDAREIPFPTGAYDPETNVFIQANITDVNGVPEGIDEVNATLSPPTETDVIVPLTFNATSGYYEGNYMLPEGAEPGAWDVNVTVWDDLGATGSNTTTFSVNTIVSLYLTNSPIDFGNTTIPIADRRADNGTAGDGYEGGAIKGYPLIITNDGNVAEDFKISGTTLVGQTNPAYTLDVGAITYNTTESTPGIALTDTATTFIGGAAKQTSQDLYFWISINTNVPEQVYKGNVTVSAIQG